MGVTFSDLIRLFFLARSQVTALELHMPQHSACSLDATAYNSLLHLSPTARSACKVVVRGSGSAVGAASFHAQGDGLGDERSIGFSDEGLLMQDSPVGKPNGFFVDLLSHDAVRSVVAPAMGLSMPPVAPLNDDDEEDEDEDEDEVDAGNDMDCTGVGGVQSRRDAAYWSPTTSQYGLGVKSTGYGRPLTGPGSGNGSLFGSAKKPSMPVTMPPRTTGRLPTTTTGTRLRGTSRGGICICELASWVGGPCAAMCPHVHGMVLRVALCLCV
jgi:hypothetical protein